jgi:putative flippase GtrA
MKSSSRFLRFCLVGGVGFGVDLLVLYASAWALGWYKARVVSFLAAATVTWWLNRRFTFDAAPGTAREDTALGRQYLAYMASMLGGALLNYATYAATLHWLDIPGNAALGVALGSCAGLVVNYLLARHLVFRQRHE